MKKGLLAAVFVMLFALVTLFGLGPVLLADGSMAERLLTLLVVMVLYVLLAAVWRWAAQRR